MRVAVYHGPNRRRLSSKFWETDVVLTTYDTLRIEQEATGPFYSGTWRRVVLDEGEGHTLNI
jgi:SNF2 family DNA or RNA helicase